MPGDLANGFFYVEAELELTNAANVTQLNLLVTSNFSGINSLAGPTVTGAGEHLPNSSGDVVPLPAKLVLRTQPAQLPTNLTNINLSLVIGFDASGAAGSATATLKLNYIALRKAYTS